MGFPRLDLVVSEFFSLLASSQRVIRGELTHLAVSTSTSTSTAEAAGPFRAEQSTTTKTKLPHPDMKLQHRLHSTPISALSLFSLTGSLRLDFHEFRNRVR